MNSQIEAAQAVIDRLVAEQEKLTQLLRGNELELRLARLELEKLQKESRKQE